MNKNGELDVHEAAQAIIDTKGNFSKTELKKIAQNWKKRYRKYLLTNIEVLQKQKD